MPNAQSQNILRIFIADLHLNGQDHAPALQFRQLLQELALRRKSQAVKLYIVGDLFHFWEEYHEEVLAIYANDLKAMRQAAEAGIEFHLFFGNRDFLYNRNRMIECCHASILGDGATVDLSNAADGRPRRAWLEHGDLLCTADRSYLRFRKIIRSLPLRLLFRCLPWFLARRFIFGLQKSSARDKARKPQRSFELDLELARSRLERQCCETLICGHLHRPQEYELAANRRLLVLPAWCERPEGWFDQDGTLRRFALSTEGSLILNVEQSRQDSAL